MPSLPTADDHALAVRAATEAGVLLLRLREEMQATGLHPMYVGDEGDVQAHRLLMEVLRRDAPATDGILSEEGRDDLVRLQAERVWIVDPLDGTREYSEPGRSDWAVHVALCIAGEPVCGAVALPSLDVTYGTDPSAPPPAPWDGPPRLVVSRSRPTAMAERIRAAIGGTLHPLGSAGAKAMAVVRGEADIYAHSGGQYEWDNAAPAAVALAAGFHASRLDGSPLRYNQADPWLPDLLICRADLADAALHALWG